MKWITAILVFAFMGLAQADRLTCWRAMSHWGPTPWGWRSQIRPAAGKVSGSGTYHLDGGFNVTEMTIYADASFRWY